MNDNICVSNVNESYFVKWVGDKAEDFRNKMKSIENLDFKILIGEGDANTTASDYASYRADTSKDFRTECSLFIYGSKTANIIFEPDDVHIVIIDNLTLSKDSRRRFMRRWEAAVPTE